MVAGSLLFCLAKTIRLARVTEAAPTGAVWNRPATAGYPPIARAYLSLTIAGFKEAHAEFHPREKRSF